MTPNQDRSAPSYLHADSQQLKLGITVMNMTAMLSNSEIYTRKLVKQNQDQEQKDLVQNIIVSAQNLSLKQIFANEKGVWL